MAIWAEIKKTINSDFSKPLNELIDDVYNRIISKNLKYTVTPSDTVQATIINSEKSRAGNTYSTICNFRAACNGTIKIKTSVKVSSNKYYGYIRVGNVTIDTYYEIETTSPTYVTKTIDILVNEGDLIDVKFKSSNSDHTVYTNLVAVCFDVESHEESLLPDIVVF
jgi:hypothetical protein